MLISLLNFAVLHSYVRRWFITAKDSISLTLIETIK